MSNDSLPSVDTNADPVVTWNVQEGAMVAAKLDPRTVCQFFRLVSRYPAFAGRKCATQPG